MSNLSFEFESDDAKAGFRLHKLEFFNWGTFDNKIWSIEPHSDNALLTGDIGSGKSTIVDAITTLIVPSQKIIFNKAAGAENKERTLKSYILGEYKNELDNETQTSKAITIRGKDSYTILLARFENEGYQETVTIAQLLWLDKSELKRVFIVSKKPLTISDDLNNFDDIKLFKKSLRKIEQIEIYDNFKPYSHAFKQLVGIQSDNALDLFNQTISMKSVGNLTDFVRNQMLDKTDIQDRIEELKSNFEELKKAHDTVISAKIKLEYLQPLVDEGNLFQKKKEEVKQLDQACNIVKIYLANKQENLLLSEISLRSSEINATNERIRQLETTILKKEESRVALEVEKQNSMEGQRIANLEKEISQLNKDKALRLSAFEKYKTWASDCRLPIPTSIEKFYENSEIAKLEISNNLQLDANLQAQRDEITIQLDHLYKNINEDKLELETIKNRQSKIPTKNLEMRKRITNALGISEEKLPFIGELLQVLDTEKIWEPAAEKVLHNFALSLIAEDSIYHELSKFVNHTDLKGRLIYFHVKDNEEIRLKRTEKQSLVNKLNIKNSCHNKTWLQQKLIEQFDYICCDDISDFHQRSNAITKEGQIKKGGERHEKDDRTQINDGRFYVLGWDNQSKIDSLINNLLKLNDQLKSLNQQQNEIKAQRIKMQNSTNALENILRISSFEEINWQVCAIEIDERQNEITALKTKSDTLATIEQKLHILKDELTLLNNSKNNEMNVKGRIEGKLENLQHSLSVCQNTLKNTTITPNDPVFNFLSVSYPFEPKSLPQYEKESGQIVTNLNQDYKKAVNILSPLEISINKKMQSYKNTYPAETAEIDASSDALDEFFKITQKLKKDDLPRFEGRFKDLLNEKTIQGILIFKNKLESYAQEISDKIQIINKSLASIDYTNDSYIKLNFETNHDNDIQDFRRKLRSCIENTLNQEDIYTEEKFLQVKAILERFSSGENIEKLWTRRVTDVRNWYQYSVTELWRSNNLQKEYYSDSAGKSGGQKEKLAYTILASALAYQFGLEQGEVRSKSFRFVVIDEAFGRGSDESTQYGLELFKKLNLQLLIVTPLQKINVIEDYISTVHFVTNATGNNSKVYDLTIEKYLTEKSKHLANLEKNEG